MACEIKNVFFLPKCSDILVIVGITINVVMSAPTLPCKVGQTPASPALPANK